jgi:hypothetical protein
MKLRKDVRGGRGGGGAVSRRGFPEKGTPHSTHVQEEKDAVGSFIWIACLSLYSNKKDYFFWTYFKQSSMTATRMMMPENTNCKLVSMPRVVRE